MGRPAGYVLFKQKRWQVAVLRYDSQFRCRHVAPASTLCTYQAFLRDGDPSRRPFVILPFAAVPVNDNGSRPLLQDQYFRPVGSFRIPSHPTGSILLSSNGNGTSVADLRLTGVNRQTTYRAVVPLVDRGEPVLTVSEDFGWVLVGLYTVLGLDPSDLCLPNGARVRFCPLLSRSAEAPWDSIVVVCDVFKARVNVVGEEDPRLDARYRVF